MVEEWGRVLTCMTSGTLEQGFKEAYAFVCLYFTIEGSID